MKFKVGDAVRCKDLDPKEWLHPDDIKGYQHEVFVVKNVFEKGFKMSDVKEYFEHLEKHTHSPRYVQALKAFSPIGFVHVESLSSGDDVTMSPSSMEPVDNEDRMCMMLKYGIEVE